MFLLIFFKEEKKGGEKETLICCPQHIPQPGIVPWLGTGDLSVHRTIVNKLSHISQGKIITSTLNHSSTGHFIPLLFMPYLENLQIWSKTNVFLGAAKPYKEKPLCQEGSAH